MGAPDRDQARAFSPIDWLDLTMRIAVANVQVPFVLGGAEVHAANLVNAFHERGIEATQVTLPFKWYPCNELINSIAISRMIDLSESNGRTIDRVIGLKFPAYLIPHPNKVLWLLHQYRSAYDLWNHPTFGDLILQAGGAAVRDAIWHADSKFIPEAKKIYANSQNVSDRLLKYNNIISTPLYHPPNNSERFHSNEFKDFLYFPSRITPLKRQILVVEALSLCKRDVKVVFSGTFESENYKAELIGLVNKLGLRDRTEFTQFITENEKIRLYSECLAVVYPPLDEDYGYVTLESMLSGKSVITTTDSGGPLEFIAHNVQGLVCEPDVAQLAAAMDRLWSDRQLARKLGAAARETYHQKNISWDNVVEALVS